ncbi:gamma-glutamylcyclotransferase [Bacillus carboniphilus]|uniref:Gamma-glutamylcyclotransferase family protein n=1 Tax=Bacillus carboniphilus TaxID=86663 RepID=A0ABN0W8X8_9BACI
MKTFVFVYGTLRKYERNHQILESSLCKSMQARVKGHLYDTDNNYPALVTSGTNGFVYGEVYEVDEETLLKLDQLEGYKSNRTSNLFDRVPVEIYTDQEILTGVTYVAGEICELQEKIELGDWRVYQYLNQKPAKVYYYAYGSCMDQERFRLANVDSYFQNEVGAGRLHGYSMKYVIAVHDGGRADIIEDGDQMEGLLYDCPPEVIDYLFEREGVYSQLYRPTLVDITVGDNVYLSCLTFKVVHSRDEIVPPLHYAREILRGSKGKVSNEYYQRLVHQLKNLEFDLTHEDIQELVKDHC